MDKIKVLLADDHPVVREGLRTMLATVPDIEVVAEASDGLEAIDKVNECHPEMMKSPQLLSIASNTGNWVIVG